MASVIAGLAGGLAATVATTAAMAATGDGGSPRDHAAAGMALHRGYGTAAGAVFAVGAATIGLDLEGARAVGLGVRYGIALMLGGIVFWLRPVIGVEPDREMLVTFGTVHLAYGLTLSGVLAAGLIG